MFDNFVYEKQCLTSEECQEIIQCFEESKEQHSPGVVEHGHRPEHKDCVEINPCLLHRNRMNEIIVPALNSLTQDYVKMYPHLDVIDKWEVTTGYNIQKYNPGQAFHATHCENNGNGNRVMAWMIYLNTVNDGGGTAFPHQNMVLKAEEGKGVIWPAYWTHIHHGVVSKTEVKYIATGWYQCVKMARDKELQGLQEVLKILG